MLALTILEAGFVGLLLAGVACWSPPAALVLCGVLGVVACERASAQVAAERARAEQDGGDKR